MLKPGDLAPDFDLEDQEGRTWRLSELRGQKVIVYFYPADDTPGCTREACDFRDSRTDLEKAGFSVLGISPQNASSHNAFSSKYGLNFPLLVDRDLSVARSYDAMAQETRFHENIPLEVTRCTFVIDERGVLTEALYDVRSKGHVMELKELLKI